MGAIYFFALFLYIYTVTHVNSPDHENIPCKEVREDGKRSRVRHPLSLPCNLFLALQARQTRVILL